MGVGYHHDVYFALHRYPLLAVMLPLFAFLMLTGSFANDMCRPKRLAFATTVIYTDAAEEGLGGDDLQSDAAEDPDSKTAKQVKTSDLAFSSGG